MRTHKGKTYRNPVGRWVLPVVPCSSAPHLRPNLKRNTNYFNFYNTRLEEKQNKTRKGKSVCESSKSINRSTGQPIDQLQTAQSINQSIDHSWHKSMPMQFGQSSNQSHKSSLNMLRPLITWPCPSLKVNGSPRSREESNFLPSVRVPEKRGKHIYILVPVISCRHLPRTGVMDADGLSFFRKIFTCKSARRKSEKMQESQVKNL